MYYYKDLDYTSVSKKKTEIDVDMKHIFGTQRINKDFKIY